MVAREPHDECDEPHDGCDELHDRCDRAPGALDEPSAALVARHRLDGPEPDLERAVAAVLAALRPGDVIAYGEVAAEAGWPGRSRAVGRVLSRSGGALPWWRVVNAAGRLAPGKEEEQARRLRDEGTEVGGRRVAGAGDDRRRG